MQHRSRKFGLVGIAFLFMLIVLGCNLASPEPPGITPTLTTNAMFQRPTATPLPDGVDKSAARVGEQATPTLIPSPTPTSTPPPPTATPIPPIIIYDEAVHPDWEVTQSDIEFDLRHTRDSYSGVYSIEIKPTGKRQVLWFTLRRDAARPFIADDVVGVTFRLYSGEDGLDGADIAMAVIGSNKYPYWVPDDESVLGLDPAWRPDDSSITRFYDEAFSPTRLYFMGINGEIPPNTWVLVTNWFDERTNDIDYTFVTGMYFRTDDGFRNDVLIDDIQMILVPKEVPVSPSADQ